MNIAKPLRITAALASLTLAACVGTTGEGEEKTGEANEAALSGNALSGNALSGNALSGNALSSESLASNEVITTALVDPNARELFKYIVGCALPQTEHVHVDVEGTRYNFQGSVGLAPEWGGPGG